MNLDAETIFKIFPVVLAAYSYYLSRKSLLAIRNNIKESDPEWYFEKVTKKSLLFKAKNIIKKAKKFFSKKSRNSH